MVKPLQSTVMPKIPKMVKNPERRFDYGFESKKRKKFFTWGGVHGRIFSVSKILKNYRVRKNTTLVKEDFFE